jgi:hypothetical protein
MGIGGVSGSHGPDFNSIQNQSSQPKKYEDYQNKLNELHLQVQDFQTKVQDFHNQHKQLTYSKESAERDRDFLQLPSYGLSLNIINLGREIDQDKNLSAYDQGQLFNDLGALSNQLNDLLDSLRKY